MTREQLINLTSLKDVENIEKKLNYFSRKYPTVPSFCIKDEEDRKELAECEKSWGKMVQTLWRDLWVEKGIKGKAFDEAFDQTVLNLNIDEDMREYTSIMLYDCHN